MEEIKIYDDYYFQMIKNKCEEFGVPKDLYVNWINEMKESKIKGMLSEFPFYLQKFEKESLETGVIAIGFNLAGDNVILWEYRKFGYPEGKLHAIEGKRKYLNKDELELYISQGYRWTKILTPPICISFSLAKEGVFYSTYEDLK